MRVRMSWEIVVGLPAAALSATLLTFAITTSGAAQGVANPAGHSASPPSCTAPGHNGPGQPGQHGHENSSPGLGLGHCDNDLDPSTDPPTDPPPTDPPADPNDSSLPDPPPGGGSNDAPIADPPPGSGPGGSAAPPAPGVIVPVDGAVIPSTDNPVSDPPGNTPGSDDDAGTPITTPPTGDPTPPVLGEVLPESAGPVPPPPTGLPNSGSGGLAATNPDADPTAATLILIATAIAIASASALHFVQRRLNGPNAS